MGRKKPQSKRQTYLQSQQKQNNYVAPPTKYSASVDIVIPVYGQLDLLRQCLSAIPKAVEDYEYSVLLFDNNSPDDPTEFYKEISNAGLIPPDRIKIFRSKENLGFPVACNRAAMRGNGVYIFFLNSDCMMHPGSISHLIRVMDSDLEAGICAPMLIFPSAGEIVAAGFNSDEIINTRPEGKVQHIGLDTSITGDVIHTLIGWSSTNPRVMQVTSSYAVTGAALFTRRSIWNRAGGFWEGYGLGTYEDVDYCLTVRELGYNIRVVPSAIGTHYVGASAMKYQLGYPLNDNKNKFLSRWGSKLQYTEWLKW